MQLKMNLKMVGLHLILILLSAEPVHGCSPPKLHNNQVPLLTELTCSPKMPVTLITAQHAARKWMQGTQRPIASKEQLLEHSCPNQHRESKWIIQSSVSQKLFDETHIAASKNGFVWATIDAYSSHHHLTIRPEEVWFSILSQISFYINAHAEELRSYFVDHKGQKELEVREVGTIHTVDFGLLAQRMAGLIQENVKDPELQTWIMPNWSTTTDNDRTVAAILMMGSMQKYFSYSMTMTCGVPSVTLLGTRADWEDMLHRLDKLSKLGDEAVAFATLLRPVIRHFVASFDPEPSPAVLAFWDKIAHVDSSMSGHDFLSGWITAFCFWDIDGKLMYHGSLLPSSDKAPWYATEQGLELDGVKYHVIDTSDVPSGFASVPVKVNDNGKIYNTTMVAGSIGMQVTSSGQMLDGTRDHKGEYYDYAGELVEYIPTPGTEQPGLDSLQALSGWFMYEKKPEKTLPKDMQSKMEQLRAVGLM